MEQLKAETRTEKKNEREKQGLITHCLYLLIVLEWGETIVPELFPASSSGGDHRGQSPKHPEQSPKHPEQRQTEKKTQKDRKSQD